MKTRSFMLNLIYLQATQSKLPELKRVILAAGDKVTMSPTFEEGIQKLANIQINHQRPKTTCKQSNKLTEKIIKVTQKLEKT